MLSTINSQRQLLIQRQACKPKQCCKTRSWRVLVCSRLEVQTIAQETTLDSDNQQELVETEQVETRIESKREDVDPSKYKYTKEKPSGVSGVLGGRGWQGEKSLLNMREDFKGSTIKIGARPESQKSGGTMKLKTVKVKGNKVVQAKVVGSGRDAIYVGFDKDEMDKKSSGQMGNYILDNAQKYPDKEDVGILQGATGGFQGGEVGLLQFLETGKVLTPQERRLLKKSNPLPSIIVSATLALAAFGYYYTHPEVQQKIQDQTSQYITFTDTQLYLAKTGLIFGGGLIGVFLILAAISNIQRFFTQGIKNLTVFIAFWGGVALFAKYLVTH
eukprot:TRINITY_DN809_c1_g1_i1.p1 TRINITY_DN809_c1_g1~~TRINITY_DN809_c1_g1_i1.p1  ORF type:complete len:330 (+),score=45.95 TRINITY_DN809_c1_g1_i1:89-1078(+)